MLSGLASSGALNLFSVTGVNLLFQVRLEGGCGGNSNFSLYRAPFIFSYLTEKICLIGPALPKLGEDVVSSPASAVGL